MAPRTGDAAKSLREEYPNAVPLTAGSGETFKWDKVGKTLVGRFLKLRDGSMGGQMVLIDTGVEGGVVTASAPTTLADAFDGVAAGTKVAIRYTGTKQSKKGQEVKLFDVVALPE